MKRIETTTDKLIMRRLGGVLRLLTDAAIDPRALALGTTVCPRWGGKTKAEH